MTENFAENQCVNVFPAKLVGGYRIGRVDLVGL